MKTMLHVYVCHLHAAAQFYLYRSEKCHHYLPANLVHLKCCAGFLLTELCTTNVNVSSSSMACVEIETNFDDFKYTKRISRLKDNDPQADNKKNSVSICARLKFVSILFRKFAESGQWVKLNTCIDRFCSHCSFEQMKIMHNHCECVMTKITKLTNNRNISMHSSIQPTHRKIHHLKMVGYKMK